MENNDRIKALEIALKLIELCDSSALGLTGDKADPAGKLIEAAEKIEQFLKKTIHH
jgi:hypothetical protein